MKRKDFARGVQVERVSRRSGCVVRHQARHNLLKVLDKHLTYATFLASPQGNKRLIVLQFVINVCSKAQKEWERGERERTIERPQVADRFVIYSRINYTKCFVLLCSLISITFFLAQNRTVSAVLELSPSNAYQHLHNSIKIPLELNWIPRRKIKNKKQKKSKIPKYD